MLLLHEGELLDVDEATSEIRGAPGEVPDVSLVDLLGGHPPRVVAPRLEGSRPQVERASIMRLQRLDVLHPEAVALCAGEDQIPVGELSSRGRFPS